MDVSALASHRRWAAAVIGVVFAGLLALTVWLLTPTPVTPGGQPEPGTDGGDGGGELAPVSLAPLTGLTVEPFAPRPALLVKVSNSPEARPQTGLDRADLVYEELTEGGVTRFIAVFHSQVPEVVGPVRSARPVDAQIASGFGRPGLAFSGARPEVLAQLARAPVVTTTEGAPGFFRDDGRYASHPYAPHDLFVRPGEVLATVEVAGALPLGDLGWVFDAEPPPGGTPASVLEVPMSRYYSTGWTYDDAAGVHRRSQEGVPSQVTGPGRIGAANVVVLAVRHYVGASGYPETDVLGAGDGLVLRDGQRYEVRWEKGTATAPLRLLGADGQPFPLAPGPTWILLPDRLPAVAPPAAG
jgi:hypothetical protein